MGILKKEDYCFGLDGYVSYSGNSSKRLHGGFYLYGGAS